MRRTRHLIALGVALGWSVAAAGPAAAGSCTVAFNGIAADRIGLASPLELSAGDALVFEGVDPAATATAVVEIRIGPVVVESRAATYEPPGEEFIVAIDLDEVAPYGVGLMKVTGATDGCSTTIWLRVGGRFPLATLAGITAAGLTIGGITGQLGAVASRRRWSRAAAALGGIATGVGAAVLGQQFGRLALSAVSVTIVVAIAAGLGFGLASIFTPARRARPAFEPTTPSHRPLDAEQPRGRASRISAAPYWCYVLSKVDVLDLDDHTRVVGKLAPGSWYLARREVGPWAHVSVGGGVDGWAPLEAIHREG